MPVNLFSSRSHRIVFLPPPTLAKSVLMIEHKLPGWWWSISQGHKEVTVSFGPGKNCPNEIDIELLKTKQGDTGFIQSFTFYSTSSDQAFLDWLENQISHMTRYRSSVKITDRNKSGLSESGNNYRQQSYFSVAKLEIEYFIFLSANKYLENNGYFIRELYLGSCDLSIDCSIRGVYPDGEEFDFSNDLLGEEDILAQSLIETRSDYLMAVLQKDVAKTFSFID